MVSKKSETDYLALGYIDWIIEFKLDFNLVIAYFIDLP